MHADLRPRRAGASPQEAALLQAPPGSSGQVRVRREAGVAGSRGHSASLSPPRPRTKTGSCKNAWSWRSRSCSRRCGRPRRSPRWRPSWRRGWPRSRRCRPGCSPGSRVGGGGRGGLFVDLVDPCSRVGLSAVCSSSPVCRLERRQQLEA